MTTNNKTEEYNGYTNIETWMVSLWLDNDYGYYSLVQELAGGINEKDEIEKADVFQLADQIENLVKENIEEAMETNTGMISDLISASLNRVNWFEIAESAIGR